MPRDAEGRRACLGNGSSIRSSPSSSASRTWSPRSRASRARSRPYPPALYRYFESLEDILDCVMAVILEASHSLPDDEVSWQLQLASWMRDLRSHLLRYPAILAMIGRSGRTSPAWLEASSALVEILGRAGLSGRDLAAGYLWVLETTVGLVMQEATLPLPDQIAHARASRHAFSATARARFAPIVHEVERIDGEGFFTFAVEQAIAAVELRAESGRKS